MLVNFDHSLQFEVRGQGHRMRNVPFSAKDACYEVTTHSETPEGSTKRAHNTYAIYWLFVEFLVPKRSV